jgi:hypothetical protein
MITDILTQPRPQVPRDAQELDEMRAELDEARSELAQIKQDLAAVRRVFGVDPDPDLPGFDDCEDVGLDGTGRTGGPWTWKDVARAALERVREYEGGGA